MANNTTPAAHSLKSKYLVTSVCSSNFTSVPDAYEANEPTKNRHTNQHRTMMNLGTMSTL